jgi:DNA-directed RNA polymerase subunit RPC12/RpoP
VARSRRFHPLWGIIVIRECRDCGESFGVGSIEQEHLVGKALSLPRRCLACRAKLRGFADRTVTCARCSNEFLFEGKLAVLLQTFGWSEPTRCIVGCDEAARKNLRGERKQIAELKEAADGSIAQMEADRVAQVEEAERPEDLFKGLDAMLEKAALAEAEDGNVATAEARHRDHSFIT